MAPMPDDAELGRLVGDVTVTYTVRELLSRIEERQVRQEAQAAAEFRALSEKVDKLESVRDRMIGAAFAVGALAGGGAGWLANLLTAN